MPGKKKAARRKGRKGAAKKGTRRTRGKGSAKKRTAGKRRKGTAKTGTRRTRGKGATKKRTRGAHLKTRASAVRKAASRRGHKKSKGKVEQKPNPTKVHSLFDYHRGKHDHEITLEQEKERFFSALPGSTWCRGCGRFANLYHRPLNSAMGTVLVLMFKAFQSNPKLKWLHVERHIWKRKNFPSSLRGDFHKLQFWGLIEQKDELRDDTSKRNGFWKLTRKGRSFVLGRRKIPLYALTYNKKLYGFAPPEVTIYDVLAGSGFDYAELMGA